MTAKGSAQLLGLLYRSRTGAGGGFLEAASAQHLLALMRAQSVNTKFGAVIPREVLANKTGENDDVSHDVGYILLPGREVSLTVLAGRAGTSAASVGEAAVPYVQQIAAAVYVYLQQPLPPSPPAHFNPAAASNPALVPKDGAEWPSAVATGATRQGPLGDTLLPLLALALSICLASAAGGVAVLHFTRRR
jgi:beta-lactamase class A